MSRPGHVPVLVAEMLRAMAPADGEAYVDGTFGRGGYAGALLAAARCRVLGIDRDPAAGPAGQALAAAHPGRFTLVAGRFSEMETLAAAAGFATADGIVLDVGVSSPQLDDPARGFSFQADGPLDMRMSATGATAADLVNTLPERDLADILHHFGEERRARAIARAIVAERARAPLTRTQPLAELIARAARRSGAIHPATRSFQALRIAVNAELEELALGLAAAERLLAATGRLVVVTFHSLEDRIVKLFLAARGGQAQGGSRHLPEAPGAAAPSFTLITRKPVTAGPEEMARNPRARSARLRAARRTPAPAHPLDPAFLPPRLSGVAS